MLTTYTFPHKEYVALYQSGDLSELTDNSAQIHVIAGNPNANASANELFEKYQTEAFTYPRGFFRRYPLQSVRLKSVLEPLIVLIVSFGSIRVSRPVACILRSYLKLKISEGSDVFQLFLPEL